MKILVTGGAGFIGSHIVDRYIELGHEVTVIDNLSTGQRQNLNSKAEFIEADMTHRQQMSQILSKLEIEVINHHAAQIKVGDSVENPQLNAEQNILGLLNVIEPLKNKGLKKIILASSGGAMYGNHKMPFQESQSAQPLSPYGVSKRVDELYLQYYQAQYQIPFLALRYANVYGPRQDPAYGTSVAIFTQMMLHNQSPIINGDGEQTRDYVFVSDVVKANELALESQYVGELNIGSGTEISVNQVFDQVAATVGQSLEKKYAPAVAGEQQHSVLDSSLAYEKLGWRAEVDFATGVQLVVIWCQQQENV